ncbi:Protein of uncharacterised function (DUF1471) [Serratia quinivorans]|jgi:hypothetical protein|uniref:DUF1471 domain-containing protein n=1 Tax=Serratia TaxID=613 RepID=UPI002177D78B|nr:DUF1471 domain-containing protein [Serratia quinivorans]CAI0845121.1 Protein of uncharacterised function (DUF1471) [Serratia quinivorans]CAI0993568.1 Protein of uncharacterised function (DUF1471) [Serratia quinivorans]CAI1009001.1 Protein of uncharacterised function (DUF1471) [Serratia quinivorans]CAI1009751.1 Protein of uncharacterised function (DUF1471) [Serratia quinivorans]CAI1041577.1 Protein of uncharacterised function (DUF1471) [Serratia quinivorans]
MKRITLVTAIALLFSANVMAATEITSHQADQRQSVGFVTLNQNVVSPDDATSQVSKIADQRGATAYRIIALHEPENNSTIHVSAELYR